MGRSTKRHQRLVEASGLPTAVAELPVVEMAMQGVGESVSAVVLPPLMAELSNDPWRAQQSQAQGMVVWLVPSVLAVVQDGDPGRAIRGLESRPLLSRDFVLLSGVVAPVDDTQAQVVLGQRVAGGQRKLGFQEVSPSPPVDLVHHLESVSSPTRSESEDCRKVDRRPRRTTSRATRTGPSSRILIRAGPLTHSGSLSRRSS